MNQRHPWKLVGPWYRWAIPASPSSGRAARPILQMYATTDFVGEFLKEPQRSLRFRAEDELEPDVLAAAVRVQEARDAKAAPHLRKVYLDTHHRFYLVVCELHCDAPGFPTVAREQVCEAGFVVRRWGGSVPPAARAKFARMQSESVAHRRPWLRPYAAASVVPGAVERHDRSPGVSLSEAPSGAYATDLSLADDLPEPQAQIDTLVKQHAIQLTLQGWVAQAPTNHAAWTAVAAEPTDLRETVHPLYPLVPDPRITKHSALGRTIYFGILPVGSSEVDALGAPRFDDRSLYEVRCFVRRHQECCPKVPGRRDCHGDLVWSPASEPYRLASQLDLVGTSHRPVTIQLPDLEALKKQAAALPFGAGVGMRMVSPPRSALEFTQDANNQPQSGAVEGAAICSFAIPLITIVATFVLRLFLPIVVFLFQLWFLLRLKFCIPPAFKATAGDGAELSQLASQWPQLGVEAKAAFDVTTDLDEPACGRLADGVVSAVERNVPANLAAEILQKHPLRRADRTVDRANLNTLGKLVLDLMTDFSADAPPDLREDFPPSDGVSSPGRLPNAVPLEFYTRVEAPAA